MPRGYYSMNTTVLNGTWYLTGGGHGVSNVLATTDTSVLSVSLQSLTERAASPQREGPSPWNKLKDAPNRKTTIASTGGGLVIFGGLTVFSSRSYAYRYIPHTKSWVSIGELPHYLLYATCVVTLPSGEVMMCGGKNVAFAVLNTVYAMKV